MKLKLSSFVSRFVGHKVTATKPVHSAANAAKDECDPTESLDGSFSSLFDGDDEKVASNNKTSGNLVAASVHVVSEDNLSPTDKLCDDDDQEDELCFGCDVIVNKTAHLRETLAIHELYNTINTIERLRTFMECHVFAVLNFMWLLKALQRELTCVQEVWTPQQGVDPNITRFINEIVLDEESDLNQKGSSHSSHYELYLEAMEQVGANTMPVKKLVTLLQQGVQPTEALETCRDDIPPPAYRHTRANLDLLQAPIGETRTARIASAFTFGREDAIPTMFLGILNGLKQNPLVDAKNDAIDFDGFTYYLERHIELDGDDHGPLALRMVEALCGGSSKLWEHAETAAIEALEERHKLWDGVVTEIQKY